MLDIDVGILIGYDCTQALDIVYRTQAQGKRPLSLETVLGWGIIGGTSQQMNDSFITCHSAILDNGNAIIAHSLKEKESPSPDDISRLLNQDFTCLELDDSKQSVEDRQFMDTLETGIKRTSDGHLLMPLPFKSQNPAMLDNTEVAVRRLMLLKKKLQHDKQCHTDYTSFTNDIINPGYKGKFHRIATLPTARYHTYPITVFIIR